MIDSSLDPQSGKAHRLSRDAERLTEWVNHRASLLALAEKALEIALDGEFGDAPLDEDDPRWVDIGTAWLAATEGDIDGAIAMLEAL